MYNNAASRTAGWLSWWRLLFAVSLSSLTLQNENCETIICHVAIISAKFFYISLIVSSLPIFACRYAINGKTLPHQPSTKQFRFHQHDSFALKLYFGKTHAEIDDLERLLQFSNASPLTKLGRVIYGRDRLITSAILRLARTIRSSSCLSEHGRRCVVLSVTYSGHLFENCFLKHCRLAEVTKKCLVATPEGCGSKCSR